MTGLSDEALAPAGLKVTKPLLPQTLRRVSDPPITSVAGVIEPEIGIPDRPVRVPGCAGLARFRHGPESAGADAVSGRALR